jgi:hypothetical protein
MSDDPSRPKPKIVHPDMEPMAPIPKPDAFDDIRALRIPETVFQPYTVQSLTVRIADYHVTSADDGLCLACDEHDFHAARRFRAADGEARRDALQALLHQLVTRIIVNDERAAAGLCPFYYPSEDEENDNV